MALNCLMWRILATVHQTKDVNRFVCKMNFDALVDLCCIVRTFFTCVSLIITFINSLCSQLFDFLFEIGAVIVKRCLHFVHFFEIAQILA